MIHKNRSLAHGGKSPVLANGNTAQIVVIADAGKGHLDTGNRLGRGRSERPAMFGRPFLGLGRGAVVNGDIVPCGFHMPRHRVSHNPQTQKCYFSHDVLQHFCDVRQPALFPC